MTKTVKKVVAGISALVILGGAAVGAWAVMENSRSSYLSFDQIEVDKEYTAEVGGSLFEEVDEAPVTDDKGDVVSSMETVPMPQGLTFRSAASLNSSVAAQAETYDSVTVKATITPSDADIESFVFEAEWVNPSSSWATGKDVEDYFTVSQSGSNSLTATLQCLQPFGEQIKVVATGTSRDGVAASANCTVDFAKRIVSANLSLYYNSTSTGESLDFSEGSFVPKSNFPRYDISLENVSFVYSDYTVEDTFETQISIKGTDEMLAKLQAGGFDNATACEELVVADGPNSFLSFDRLMFVGVLTRGKFFDIGVTSWDGENAEIVNDAVAILRENVDIPVLEMTLNATGTYSEVTYSVDLYTVEDFLFTTITDVTLDHTEVII